MRGPGIRLVNSTGVSPQLHFFCYEMSSLARNKAVRGTLATRIVCYQSTDDDVAEVLLARDRPASRIRAHSRNTNCFSLLTRRDSVQSPYLRVALRKVAHHRFSMFLLLAG